MFNKLKSLFSSKPEDYTQSALLIRDITSQLHESQKLVDHLQELLKEKTSRQTNKIFVSGFDDLSHEPTDTTAREQYAGRVGEFYDDILKAKISTSIAEIRHSLAAVGTEFVLPYTMTRSEYDYFLRGIEAGLWKINDWAVLLQGELKNKSNESI